MTTDLNVESIVAQIRKRLAEEGANGWSAHKQAESPSTPPILHSCRTRMTEDSWRFADLDSQTEAASAGIGNKPPVPPTWRGRFGAWLIDVLRRLLWWYTAPLQETIGLLTQRNREQAVRHLQLQEQILSLFEAMQPDPTRVEAVEHLREELAGLRSESRKVQQQSQWEMEALNHAVEVLSRQLSEVKQTQLQMEHGLRNCMDELQQSARDWRAFSVTRESYCSELEQRMIATLQEHLREVREGGENLNGFAQRLPELEAQVYAEIESRETLAAKTNQQAERIEQTLAAHAQHISQNLQSLEIRLPVLEEQFRTEIATHEAFALQITGQVAQLQQNLKNLQTSHVTSDAARTELAQRVSEAAHAMWGRLPVLEMQLAAESEARESSAKQSREDVERLEQRLNLELTELKGGLDQLRTAGPANESADDRISRTETRISQLALAAEKQRHDLLAQAHRVSVFLREVRSCLPKTVPDEQLRQMAESSEDEVAPLYAEFEDVFRGSRDEIKQRLRIYLPRLKDIKGPVLDLGCGRGEWLELLSEHHLAGRGVDANSSMIRRCTALGLDVVKTDALAHLRSLPDKSLGGITSFHMIEHLPFKTVLAIVCEALRVLESGGVLILETPNPQNALVGSQTFWIDPTHKHPIPSQTLRFFVEAHGFCDVEVLNLQPYPEAIRVPEDCGELARRFNDYFYGPQDYSVIGRRP